MNMAIDHQKAIRHMHINNSLADHELIIFIGFPFDGVEEKLKRAKSRIVANLSRQYFILNLHKMATDRK